MTNRVRFDSFGDGEFDLSPSVLSGKPRADFFLSIKKAAPLPHGHKWWKVVFGGVCVLPFNVGTLIPLGVKTQFQREATC